MMDTLLTNHWHELNHIYKEIKKNDNYILAYQIVGMSSSAIVITGIFFYLDFILAHFYTSLVLLLIGAICAITCIVLKLKNYQMYLDIYWVDDYSSGKAMEYKNIKEIK